MKSSNNRKKQLIGIVTWFYYPNPGTAFQAYALQQFINSIPHCRAEIVNMLGSNPKDSMKAPINRYYAKQYGFLSIPIRVILGIRSYLYCSFQRKYIVKWPTRTLIREEYSCVNDRYDWVILVSDQIWNLHLNPNSKFDKVRFFTLQKFIKIPEYPSFLKIFFGRLCL